MLIIFLTLLFLVSDLTSQEKTDFIYINDDDTNYIPYMYLNSDTLDYADGGTLYIAIKDLRVYEDKITQDYIISGWIITIYGESLGNLGFVTTGEIKKIEAKTWTGFTQTGLLINDRSLIFTKQSKFKIKVPIYYKGYIIFSAVGGFTVIYFNFKKFINEYLTN